MKAKLLLIGFLFSIKLCSQGYFVAPEFYPSDDGFISKAIDADIPSDYSFLGVSAFHHDLSLRILEYRILVDGSWLPWVPLVKNHEGHASDRIAYEGPPIRQTFSLIQFRQVCENPAGLSIRFFIANHSHTDSGSIETRGDCEMPEHCDRACWCDSCPVDPTPEFTEPTHIIVHHSAGFTESDNFKDVVAYYYDLHVNTNGWDDIGYNWLIDANGIIYMGRPDDYQGAHFSCINENTVGICMIGDFSMTDPSDEAIRSLVSLIAFEASDHTIDVLESSYHLTGDFLIENISGHRDGNDSDNGCSTTACPGDNLYGLLAFIREQVSEVPCYQETISSTSGLHSQKWTIFPNPSSSRLYVGHNDKSGQTAELIGGDGSFISKLTIGQDNTVDQIPSGVYFIKYKGQIIEKIVVTQP